MASAQRTDLPGLNFYPAFPHRESHRPKRLQFHILCVIVPKWFVEAAEKKTESRQYIAKWMGLALSNSLSLNWAEATIHDDGDLTWTADLGTVVFWLKVLYHISFCQSPAVV